jgi:hypothetical protein
MDQLIILGVMVQQREKNASTLQHIFSKYGCCIKTRIGLNEQPDEAGLIILELMGDKAECERLENEILALDDLKVQKMIF